MQIGQSAITQLAKLTNLAQQDLEETEFLLSEKNRSSSKGHPPPAGTFTSRSAPRSSASLRPLH
jgi:hypothetical protein